MTRKVGGNESDTMQLRLNISDNLVFVYPNVRNDQRDRADQDDALREVAYRPTISVCVTLDVPVCYDALSCSRRIASVLVELVADETLGFPNAPTEHNTITYGQHNVDATQLHLALEAGHSYDFHAVLPVAHDVAPYELCRFGQVLPRVRATLTWDHSNEEATASSTTLGGLGKWLRGDSSKNAGLQVQQDVWIIAVPCTLNPLDYAFTHRSFSENLGPIIVHAATQHLTIGGYLRLGLSLPAIAPECEIEQVRLTLVQNVKLKSRCSGGARQQGLISLRRRGSSDDEPVVVTCEPDKTTILTFDKKTLKQNRREHGLLGDWIARLPFHGGARPSTLVGSTGAALVIQHTLELTVMLSMPSGTHGDQRKTSIYFAEWALPTLASCSCRWRALRLPDYSEKDPLAASSWMSDLISPSKLTGTPPFVQFGRHRSHRAPCDWSLCACGVSQDELLQYESEQDCAERKSTVATMYAELQQQQQQQHTSAGPSTNDATDRNAAPSTQPPNDLSSVSSNSNVNEERRRLLMEQKAAQEYRPTIVS